MPYGFGRGWGFGFRGASPPWPYVGVGRGGLPRCGYFLGGAAWLPVWGEYAQSTGLPSVQGVPPAYPQYAQSTGLPSVQGVPPAYPEPFVNSGDEIKYLQSQADLLKRQLEQIEKRIRDIEIEKP